LARSAADIDLGKAWLDRTNITFRSDAEVDGLREQYHSYHLTQVNDTNVWRHHVVDFTRGLKDPHILRAIITTTDGSIGGTQRSYEIEGGKRGDHLLMFYRPSSDERQSVVVFPFFRTPGRNYGTISGVNWDGKQFFGKVILSRVPINGMHNDGTLSPAQSKTLDEDWNRGFVSNNLVPPDAFSLERRYTTNGIAGIYQKVRVLLGKRAATEHGLQIRILGFTLFSVLSELRSLFEAGLLRGVAVTLYHLEPSYLGLHSKEFDSGWRKDVERHVAEIKSFIEANAPRFEQTGVTFRFVPYGHFPSVHGFAYGDQTYFVSFASRDGSGKVRIPYKDVFMRVERGDESPQARAFVDLFQNGIDTAEASLRHRSRPPLSK
jgi:hypothetical protein